MHLGVHASCVNVQVGCGCVSLLHQPLYCPVGRESSTPTGLMVPFAGIVPMSGINVQVVD